MFPDKEIFSLYTFAIHVTPCMGHFWPQGHNLNKLGRDLIDDAKYKTLEVSNKIFFSCFPYISLLYIKRTTQAWDHFSAQGYNLN